MFNIELPPSLTAISTMLAILCVVEALRRTGARTASIREHIIWSVATTFVFLGHQMTISLPHGWDLHYLGGAFLALLLGYPRALVSMTLVLSASAMMNGQLQSLALQIMLSGVLPITLMVLTTRNIARRMPPNLFVFLIGTGLLCLFAIYALEISIALLVRNALANAPDLFLTDVFAYALLLASGEAWLEGMLITVLVAFVPGAVRLFDEDVYLRSNPGR